MNTCSTREVYTYDDLVKSIEEIKAVQKRYEAEMDRLGIPKNIDHIEVKEPQWLVDKLGAHTRHVTYFQMGGLPIIINKWMPDDMAYLCDPHGRVLLVFKG